MPWSLLPRACLRITRHGTSTHAAEPGQVPRAWREVSAPPGLRAAGRIGSARDVEEGERSRFQHNERSTRGLRLPKKTRRPRPDYAGRGRLVVGTMWWAWREPHPGGLAGDPGVPATSLAGAKGPCHRRTTQCARWTGQAHNACDRCPDLPKGPVLASSRGARSGRGASTRSRDRTRRRMPVRANDSANRGVLSARRPMTSARRGGPRQERELLSRADHAARRRHSPCTRAGRCRDETVYVPGSPRQRNVAVVPDRPSEGPVHASARGA